MCRRQFSFAGRAIVAAACLASASAGAIETPLSSALRWRLLGPFRGGRAISAAGVASNPETFYFGAVGGGVWKSTNAGRTWRAIFDGEPFASIGAIAVAPSDPNVLYVGTGEADMRSDISVGNGLFKSTDAGQSWKASGLASSQQIGRILVDPRDPSRLLVAVLGHPYGANPERGVFLSTDGGGTWDKTLGRGADTGAIDLAFDPADSRHVYASMWRTRRPPWNVYPPSKGPGSGLFRSTDAGRTWAALGGRGFPTAGVGRIGIAPAPSMARRLYAVVDAEQGGLYRSDDAGASWSLVDGDERLWQRGWYFGGVTVDPRDPDRVYVCNTALYRSVDGGKSFAVFKGAPGGDDYHSLWIDPSDPGRMVLASDQGAAVSIDGGATWSSWYNQPTGQFYHVAVDPRFPFRAFGAQQDSGAAVAASRGPLGWITARDWDTTCAGGENGYIAVDPVQRDVIFGERVDRCDLVTGQSQDVSPTLGQSGPFRHTWTLPLAFSPADPKALYFGNQYLFRTTDSGASWTRISPDLTREHPAVPRNLDAATASIGPVAGDRRGVIYSIAPSPQEASRIWIGTDDGRIEVTADGGQSWRDVTPPSLSAWSKVTMLEASRFDRETVFAAIDRHRVDDFDPHVLRTTDAGAHWAEVTEGLPAGAWVNAIREDPVRRGLLYAGTETGIYDSVDSGGHWRSLQLNLPHCPIRDIAFSETDVVVGTHGRAFWALDDVSSLRQLPDVPAAAAAHLFRPSTALRVRRGGNWGTPIPQDEPLAENPPSGAVIDYFLARGEAGPVSIEVRDASGSLVRAFSSEDAAPAVDLATVPFSPFWIPPPPRLSAAAGLHRFVWDLREESPEPIRSAEDIFREPGGAWVVPGRYTVTLSAAGAKLSQPLEVRLDPRIAVTAGALDRAHEISHAAAGDLRRALSAIAEVEKAKGRLAKNSSARANEARLELQSIEGEAPDRKREGLGLPAAEREPASLQAVAEDLRAVRQAVDGSDSTPTSGASSAFTDAHRRLEAALQRWTGLAKKFR